MDYGQITNSDMIEITNLKKTFGEKTAVDIERLMVADGEMLGLVGNNGAGKTTLFRLVLDLLLPDQGGVRIGGIDVRKSEEWKLTTGAYIDDGFLIGYLTPEEYFLFVGRMNRLTRADVNERLAELEDFFRGEVLGQQKYIRNFSAGNKQKIGIAGAMLNRPSLLMLDEPFNFLDPSSQAVIKHKLTELCHTQGTTILLSSHNLTHTVDICSRVVLMESGRIVHDLPNVDQSARAILENYFFEPQVGE